MHSAVHQAFKSNLWPSGQNSYNGMAQQMSESKRRIYMSIVAFSIAIWAFNNFQGRGKVVAESLQKPLMEKQLKVAQKAIPLDFTFVKEKPWGADPFYRRIANVSPTSTSRTELTMENTYELKAIIFNSTSPSAFLNGRVVKTGDFVDGAKIIKISKRAVTLEVDGREVMVTVKRG